MKVCVIHGSSRKNGNTECTIGLVKKNLSRLGEVMFEDVLLPQDLPHFCLGCFACMHTGEYAGQNCPHKQYTHPILQKMLDSDGIVIASPSYSLAESGQVKAFLDHFACTYVNHRPNEAMFSKIVFVVSTAAGAGTHHVVSNIARSVRFWGVNRVVSYTANLWALNWGDMPKAKRGRREAKLAAKTRRFYRLMKRRMHLHRRVRAWFWFRMCRQLIGSYAPTEPDRIYWTKKGWLK